MCHFAFQSSSQPAIILEQLGSTPAEPTVEEAGMENERMEIPEMTGADDKESSEQTVGV